MVGRKVGGEGKADPHPRPFTLAALRVDASAVRLDDCLGYWEPQARAALFAAAGLVHAVEALEDSG